jgi:hypothetical protein
MKALAIISEMKAQTVRIAVKADIGARRIRSSSKARLHLAAPRREKILRGWSLSIAMRLGAASPEAAFDDGASTPEMSPNNLSSRRRTFRLST